MLHCTKHGAGAVVGWHRVVLDDPNAERPAQGQPLRNPPRVAPRYASAASAPFHVQVKPGSQTIDLDLSPP